MRSYLTALILAWVVMTILWNYLVYITLLRPTSEILLAMQQLFSSESVIAAIAGMTIGHLRGGIVILHYLFSA